MVSATAGVVIEQRGDEWAGVYDLGICFRFEPPNARLDHTCIDSFLDSRPE
jgi:hypothetical protein